MMELITLEFPLDRDVMTTVRLTTGGICSLVGFNLEDAEDCKVCVTESLLLLLHSGSSRAKLRFEREEKLLVTVEGEGEPIVCDSMEEEISVALLRALVEDLTVQSENGVTRIRFRL